jgi:hypothetical protein
MSSLSTEFSGFPGLWTCDLVKERRDDILGSKLSEAEVITLEAHTQVCGDCGVLLAEWCSEAVPEGLHVAAAALAQAVVSSRAVPARNTLERYLRETGAIVLHVADRLKGGVGELGTPLGELARAAFTEVVEGWGDWAPAPTLGPEGSGGERPVRAWSPGSVGNAAVALSIPEPFWFDGSGRLRGEVRSEDPRYAGWIVAVSFPSDAGRLAIVRPMEAVTGGKGSVARFEEPVGAPLPTRVPPDAIDLDLIEPK